MEVAFLPLKNNPKITLQKIFPFYMIRFFHAGFSTLVLLTFWARQLVGGAVLCTVGCQAAPLSSTLHDTRTPHVTSLSPDIAKYSLGAKMP